MKSQAKPTNTYQPLSCYQAALLAKTQDWEYPFLEFVDDFRRTPNRALLVKDPLPVNLEPHLYALLQSICLRLCQEFQLKPPRWLNKNLFLPKPWFVSGCKNLYATALQESPVAFRKNNIFVLGNFLNRV